MRSASFPYTGSPVDDNGASVVFIVKVHSKCFAPRASATWHDLKIVGNHGLKHRLKWSAQTRW